MKRNEKYTIFGHNGFLGKNIVHYLKTKKIKYFLPGKKVKFSKNLNNVIYCVGVYDVLDKPTKAIDASIKLLSNVIINNKFKSFLLISSTRLYLNSAKTKENDNILVDPHSKDYFFNSLRLTAENFCLSQNNKKIKVVRISNLYGDFFKNQKYFLPNLIRNSIKNKLINISINKNLKKNYLNVHDAIEIIFKIINKSKHRLYNVASDKRYSLDFISNTIQKITKCKRKLSNQKYRYDEPIININRVKKEFKFKPKNDFKEKLQNIIKEFNI